MDSKIGLLLKTSIANITNIGQIDYNKWVFPLQIM